MDLRTELKNRWTELCKKNYAQYGDEGCCVIGAGVGIGFSDDNIVDAHDVAQCQGNMNWERGLTPLLAELSAKYNVKLVYNYGMMD